MTASPWEPGLPNERLEKQLQKSLSEGRQISFTGSAIKISSISGPSHLRRLWIEQGGACYYCQSQADEPSKKNITLTAATIDHKIPRAKGGKNSIENKCMACKKCNQEKSTLTDKEFHLVILYRRKPELFAGFL